MSYSAEQDWENLQLIRSTQGRLSIRSVQNVESKVSTLRDQIKMDMVSYLKGVSFLIENPDFYIDNMELFTII